MRWFYDTEFHDDGRTIDLISIALVSEAGDEYYAVSSDYDWGRSTPWLREHVLPKLGLPSIAKPRDLIAREIQGLLLGSSPEPKPVELWAYFADYDHVALCQLYGTMMDFPKGMPMLTFDFKQVMMHAGIEKKDLPRQDPATEHSALADARWLRQAFRLVSKELHLGSLQ